LANFCYEGDGDGFHSGLPEGLHYNNISKINRYPTEPNQKYVYSGDAGYYSD
jgi:hypothetical protein